MGLDSKWVTQVTLIIRLKAFNGKPRRELFGGRRMGSWTTGQPQKNKQTTRQIASRGQDTETNQNKYFLQWFKTSQWVSQHSNI